MNGASRAMNWMGVFFGLLFVGMAWSSGSGPSTSPKALQETKLAGLSDNLPGLFVGLINDVIEGEIRPRKIQYQAPSTVVLQDVVVFAPGTRAVAKVEEVRATVSLSSLLRGNIVIEVLELRRPRLLLELEEGKLNLLEAFALKPTSTAKKKDEKSSPPDMEIRIDSFSFSEGGLRFRDQKSAVISADDAQGSGRVEIEVATGKVLVVVDKLKVASGSLKLKDLDLHYEKVEVRRIQFLENRLNLDEVKAKVQGANVRVTGAIHVLDDGDLDLVGHASVPAGTWPDRLAAPPFPMPDTEVGFKVQGAFATPLVLLDARTSSFEAFEFGIQEVDAKVRITTAAVFLDDVKVKLSQPDRKNGVSSSDVSSSDVSSSDVSSSDVSSSDVSSSGALKVVGDWRIKALVLDVTVGLLNVPLALALVPAKIEPAPTGILHGNVQIIGVVDGKHA
ncbi:MAG: AsmA family protein, partial [Deltaproteobacteria bacterium]|nr:AsmA family protein [Deltaproteobacteria bacterium]